ncbi:FlgN protein [Lachnospiraceae bacterium C10]|nr:flagellar protein FlgN [Lachnospiraceae bacterium]SCW34899.1 FlgN protein [Lachnospiraceae bacterium C10]SDW21218.1 FlgN protein [Lachnospiraceae bacterium KHCPX20]
MASLVEELLSVMQEEKDGYDKLYALSEEKRGAIVKRNLQRLEEVNTAEERVASDLKNLENKRTRCLADMSAVLGHDRELLTVTQIIDLLANQPKEQKQLQEAKELLVRSATRMQQLNEQIQVLLQQALEMTEFDLTLFRSLKGGPETANYNRNAYNTGDVLPSSGFDAKQ